MTKPILWSSTFTSGTLAHMAAAEAGVDLDIHFISLRQGEHKTPEFLAINPKGQVPALQIGPGRVITEGPAVLTYIARMNPDAGLMPADPYAEARTIEWMAWVSLQFGTVFQPIFMPGRFTSDPSAEASVTARGRERAAETFTFADAALAHGEVPTRDDGGVTLAELYFFFLGMGARFLKMDLSVYPALTAHHARMGARPRIAAALTREQEHG